MIGKEVDMGKLLTLILVCFGLVVIISIITFIICKKDKATRFSNSLQILSAILSLIGGVGSVIGLSSSNVTVNNSDINNSIANNITGNNNTVNNFYGDGINFSQNNQAEGERPDLNGSVTPSVPDGMETVEKYVVGWGDNTGGRQAYTIDDINNGALGTAIVFNSISDGAIGHEFNFVGARTSDGKDLWSGNVIEAVEGEIYRVRIYAHNNNPGAYLALAKDVSVRFNLAKPVRVTGNDIALDGFNSGNGYYAAAVHGFISVSNGTPSEYWDGVKFVSNRPFHLEYITGTATYENSGIGAGGYRLSDNVVKDYVKIGYDEMNGEIPGCFGYASYTTILVKPVFDD